MAFRNASTGDGGWELQKDGLSSQCFKMSFMYWTIGLKIMPEDGVYRIQ